MSTTHKERPILFSAPMVRALLDGTKTQTRRVAKLTDAAHIKEVGGHRRWHPADPDVIAASPYGQVGDQLWVRETFVLEQQVESDQKPPHNDGRPIKYVGEFEPDTWLQPHYRATDTTPELGYEDCEEPTCRWKRSIFMPRWASRITLEITDVRVERLQDITAEDALAEGIKIHENFRNRNDHYGPIAAYRDLWESLNGAGSWDLNPWVWVIEFKKVKP